MARWAGAALILGLGACSADGPSFNLSVGRSATEIVAVAGGAVVVGGPPGYCIDRRGSALSGQPAFVLLASCASLTRRIEDGAPEAPGLLTASVDTTSGEVPDLQELRSFLRSAPGRATLARDGQAASVTVRESAVRGGALIFELRDTSAPTTEGLAEIYWRGLFALEGRLITVTVNAFDARPLGSDAGRRKLEQLIARIRLETLAERQLGAG